MLPYHLYHQQTTKKRVKELYSRVWRSAERPNNPAAADNLKKGQHHGLFRDGLRVDQASSSSQTDRRDFAKTVNTKRDQTWKKQTDRLAQVKNAFGKKARIPVFGIVLLLKTVHYLMVTYGWSKTSAEQEAAASMSMGKETVRAIVNEYLAHTDVIPHDKLRKKVGRGSTVFMEKYKDTFMILKFVHLKSIKDFVEEQNSHKGGMTTVRRIVGYLKGLFGLDFSRRCVEYALNTRLGYRYATPAKCKLKFTGRRLRLTREFVLKFDAALKLEKKGGYVIVFMDETYVHTNHCPSRAWFSGDGSEVNRSRSKGKLTVILHAICVGGLVSKGNPGIDRKHCRMELEIDQKTAELIFAAKSACGDYHDQFNGEMFQMWLEYRLKPAFEALFPGKKMILVLDNAPYHHLSADGTFFAHQHNKAEIKAKLTELKYETITVRPFTRNLPPPPTPTAASGDHTLNSWVFVDMESRECFLIDGPGEKDGKQIIIYAKISRSQVQQSECPSSYPADMRRLLFKNKGGEKEGYYHFLGYGDPAVRAVQRLIDGAGKLPKARLADNPPSRWRKAPPRAGNNALAALVEEVSTAYETEKVTTHQYNVSDVDKKYDGWGGGMGKGGPKGEWLKDAAHDLIKADHPALLMTAIQRKFRKWGWLLIFTVPYWADSQPIELIWAIVKNWVADHYFVGRNLENVYEQLQVAFYGGKYKGKKYNGITKTSCKGVIQKAKEKIEAVCQKDNLLKRLVGWRGKCKIGTFTDASIRAVAGADYPFAEEKATEEEIVEVLVKRVEMAPEAVTFEDYEGVNSAMASAVDDDGVGGEEGVNEIADEPGWNEDEDG